jgi:hypothetical protein
MAIVAGQEIVLTMVVVVVVVILVTVVMVVIVVIVVIGDGGSSVTSGNSGDSVSEPPWRTVIGGSAGDPPHIGPASGLGIRTEGSPVTGLTLAGCRCPRVAPLGSCRADDGRTLPTAPVPRGAGVAGVVCQACNGWM